MNGALKGSSNLICRCMVPSSSGLFSEKLTLHGTVPVFQTRLSAVLSLKNHAVILWFCTEAWIEDMWPSSVFQLTVLFRTVSEALWTSSYTTTLPHILEDCCGYSVNVFMLYSLISFVCWYRFVHTFVELEEVYSKWVPNFQYEQFIFHKVLIIFIAYVNDPFIPSAFPFHWCVYLLSTAPLLYRRDKRRTGQKKRPNRGTNQWLPCLVYDSALRTIATNLTGKKLSSWDRN